MAFDADQRTMLDAPLNRASVKTRKQGGRDVCYIEGWHVIAEANRIFGFDGWSRETVDIKCVSEKERTIGADKSPGYGVTYICKVRVNASGIIREGCGTGHGIDRDLGQAHESALKEAETDAMKRALMTFGNQFGLALYDKEQAGVEGYPEAKKPAVKSLDPDASFNLLKTEIINCKTLPALRGWASQEVNKQRRAGLPELLIEKIDIVYGDQLAALQQ